MKLIRKLNSGYSKLAGKSLKSGGYIKEVREFAKSEDAVKFVSDLDAYEVNNYSYLTTNERNKEKDSLIASIKRSTGNVVLMKVDYDDEDASYSAWILPDKITLDSLMR